MPLPDRFDPSAESKLYERWLDAQCFGADAKRSKRNGGQRDTFTIVIPPPNVTAILHLGHALDDVTQDVLIRWARMRQQEALWVPGTDHAGIATQNVVEKLIAKEGKTRFDLGRAAFVQRTEQFVAETGGTILRQLRAIGASADWSRTAYTLSPELSRAVREAFVRLFDAGLIYKGHRVIHWCPRCLTSLSDEEAEFHDETGSLYHIAYPLAENRELNRAEGAAENQLVIATTRPETLLADVAVAVNPKDSRYKKLIGQTVVLPIVGIEIPIIADEYADPEFGTGVVKITPAHDANDFEVGMRHKLPMPVVIDADGAMAEGDDAEGRVPEFVRGDDRLVARKKIVQALQESGALVKTATHQHSVRHCYRCQTVVEPRLSDQWFVRMEPLAKPALEGLRNGAIRILPERWEGVYVHWLENIRDWNISRQLWWGHRIPVWYCLDCDPPYDMYVSRTDITKCPHCGGAVRQDEDVLDTWFSSWLWPLSTLGWPDEKHEDLRAFYPTDVLVSGPDIIFFWVARMVMAGYQFTGRSPYHTILLHGMARDAQGRKMSKSLGNGFDPMEVVRLYGADALRWTLVSGMGLGADITLDPDDLEKTFAPGRNFVTKLWNIGRFLLEKAGSDAVRPVKDIAADRLHRSDEWILSRLDVAIGECDAAFGPLRPTTPLDTPDRVRWTEQERHALERRGRDGAPVRVERAGRLVRGGDQDAPGRWRRRCPGRARGAGPCVRRRAPIAASHRAIRNGRVVAAAAVARRRRVPRHRAMARRARQDLRTRRGVRARTRGRRSATPDPLGVRGPAGQDHRGVRGLRQRRVHRGGRGRGAALACHAAHDAGAIGRGRARGARGRHVAGGAAGRRRGRGQGMRAIARRAGVAGEAARGARCPFVE
jgi:valyl-tRNA synthetase